MDGLAPSSWNFPPTDNKERENMKETTCYWCGGLVLVGYDWDGSLVKHQTCGEPETVAPNQQSEPFKFTVTYKSDDAAADEPWFVTNENELQEILLALQDAVVARAGSSTLRWAPPGAQVQLRPQRRGEVMRLIDLCNKLHIFRCDRCGRRMKGWKASSPFQVPLCAPCGEYLAAKYDHDRNEVW